MAASKPISWLYTKNTSSLSLNNNFGTFNSCSGLFPFRHTTLSYYVREFKNHHSPSESKSPLIKSSRPPNVCKPAFIFMKKSENKTETCPALQFCTCYDVIQTTYLYRFRRNGFIFLTMPSQGLGKAKIILLKQ